MKKKMKKKKKMKMKMKKKRKKKKKMKMKKKKKIVDPLGEGNCSDPISMPPWHFHNPMRVLEKGIPLAGQDIDRMQQVFVGRPHTGSILSIHEWSWPFLNDFLKRLKRIAHWACRGNRTGTCFLIKGSLEDHSKDMDLSVLRRPL